MSYSPFNVSAPPFRPISVAPPPVSQSSHTAPASYNAYTSTPQHTAALSDLSLSLSGLYRGECLYTSPPPSHILPHGITLSSLPLITSTSPLILEWCECEIYWNLAKNGNGMLNGKGQCWYQGTWSIPFVMEGTIRNHIIKLIKVDLTGPSHAESHTLTLDPITGHMEGQHSLGTIRLDRIGDTYSTNSSVTSSPSSTSSSTSYTSLPPQLNPRSSPFIPSYPTSTSTSTSTSPLRSFLDSLFGNIQGAKYAQMLESQEVDFEALLMMKESHLKELGIPMGPRVRILSNLPRADQSNGHPSLPTGNTPPPTTTTYANGYDYTSSSSQSEPSQSTPVAENVNYAAVAATAANQRSRPTAAAVVAGTAKARK